MVKKLGHRDGTLSCSVSRVEHTDSAMPCHRIISGYDRHDVHTWYCIQVTERKIESNKGKITGGKNKQTGVRVPKHKSNS